MDMDQFIQIRNQLRGCINLLEQQTQTCPDQKRKTTLMASLDHTLEAYRHVYKAEALLYGDTPRGVARFCVRQLAEQARQTKPGDPTVGDLLAQLDKLTNSGAFDVIPF